MNDKEKLNNPLKDWQIFSAISSMIFFHTVQCDLGAMGGRGGHQLNLWSGLMSLSMEASQHSAVFAWLKTVTASASKLFYF